MLLDEKINNYLPQIKLEDPKIVGFDLFMDERVAKSSPSTVFQSGIWVRISFRLTAV